MKTLAVLHKNQQFYKCKGKSKEEQEKECDFYNKRLFKGAEYCVYYDNTGKLFKGRCDCSLAIDESKKEGE